MLCFFSNAGSLPQLSLVLILYVKLPLLGSEFPWSMANVSLVSDGVIAVKNPLTRTYNKYLSKSGEEFLLQPNNTRLLIKSTLTESSSDIFGGKTSTNKVSLY